MTAGGDQQVQRARANVSQNKSYISRGMFWGVNAPVNVTHRNSATVIVKWQISQKVEG
jgi:hypothetical protein